MLYTLPAHVCKLSVLTGCTPLPAMCLLFGGTAAVHCTGLPPSSAGRCRTDTGCRSAQSPLPSWCVGA